LAGSYCPGSRPVTKLPEKESLSIFPVVPLTRSPLSPLFPRLNKPSSLSLSSLERCSDHLHGPFLDALQQLHIFLVLDAPDLDAVLQVRPHEGRIEGDNHLPDLLGILLLIQPRVRLAFWAESALFILSFSSTDTPKSFSRMPSMHSLTSLYQCLELPQSKCGTLYLTLLNQHNPG